MNVADYQVIQCLYAEPRVTHRVSLATAFNTDTPPCDDCPNRPTCQSSCRAFRRYTDRGKYLPDDRGVNLQAL